MPRTVTLPSGQRVVVLGPGEAVNVLNCISEELGAWLDEGAIQSCRCPNCGFNYPVASDVEDLLRFAGQFPDGTLWDEIISERVRNIGRRGPQPQRERKVNLNPRDRLRTTDAYEEDGHRQQTFERLQPGRR